MKRTREKVLKLLRREAELIHDSKRVDALFKKARTFEQRKALNNLSEILKVALESVRKEL